MSAEDLKYPAFHEGTEGVCVRLKVNPRSGRDQLLDLTSEAIKVKLAAPPVEGEANRALVKFIASACGVARADVEIISGKKSRHKTILVRGLELRVVIDRLNRLASS